MKTVIVYASVYHGNTKKLVEKIAEKCKVDLIDAVQQPKADLSDYDRIGFASGIYFSKFHQTSEAAERAVPGFLYYRAFDFGDGATGIKNCRGD